VALAEVVLYLYGAEQKWDAALIGTVVPFWYVASVNRNRWFLRSFWTALSICFVAHLALMTFLFTVVLRNVRNIGLLLWIPVLMIEGLALYMLVDLYVRHTNGAGGAP
jgi:hypothetical protein